VRGETLECIKDPLTLPSPPKPPEAGERERHRATVGDMPPETVGAPFANPIKICLLADRSRLVSMSPIIGVRR
jgi:hypothetical protein